MKYWYNLGLILLVCLLGIYVVFTHPIKDKTSEEKNVEQIQEEVENPIEIEEKEEIVVEPQEIEKEEIQQPTLISLGVYKITAYCGCEKCCGNTHGITASGTHVTAGRTIAAPSDIPFGTQLVINGHTYTVEDRGGAIKGKRIDIYFESHDEALNFGVQYIEVFKVIK